MTRRGIVPSVLAWVVCASCGDPRVPEQQGGADGQTTSTSGSTSQMSSSSAGSTVTTTTSADATSDAVSTTGDEEVDVSSGDGGSSFLSDFGQCAPLPDGTMAHCTPSTCDPYEQDCPDGEACRPWANNGSGVWNDLRCSPVPRDPDLVGEGCTVEGGAASGVDTCELGALCWGVDEMSLEGTCVELCGGHQGAPTCDVPGETCFPLNDGTLPLCLTGCDPLNSACEEGSGCYPTNGDTFVCLEQDLPVQVGPLAHTTCEPGSLMILAKWLVGCEDTACCRLFCSLDDVDPCGAGEECTPYFSDPAPDPIHDDLGVCAASKD